MNLLLSGRNTDILGENMALIPSVLTICMQTGTCDTRSGDLVFFSAAFDEFSFTKD